MNTNTLVDLTQSLTSHIPIYPDDPSFSLIPYATVSKDGYSVHEISCGTHTGTHIDAPAHFFENGVTLTDIPLSSLIGPLVLVDLAGDESDNGTKLKNREEITWKVHIEPALARSSIEIAHLKGAIVLIRTGWGETLYDSSRYYHHPYLSRAVAQQFFDAGVRILGVDTLSPDQTPYEGVGEGASFGCHEVFLAGGRVIAENLTNLREAKQKGCNMVALAPLKLEGSDGSPCRAFAWKT